MHRQAITSIEPAFLGNSKMTNATKTLDFIAIAKSTAAAIHAGITAVDTVNTQAKTLREAGFTFGKSIKTCVYRRNLDDAMCALWKGKAKKTYANYVTSFVKAVNEGTEFSLSDSKGKAKGAKGAKAADKSADEKMLSALLNVWKLSDVAEDVLIQVETALADGSSLADALEYVLESNGIELNKGEDK